MVVGLVFGRMEKPGAWRIAHVSFSPWGAWPLDLGPDFQASVVGGDSFAVAPALPSAQPGFAALFYMPSDVSPWSTYLATAAAPMTSYDSFPDGVSWSAWQPTVARALAHDGTRYLAAFETPLASTTRMSLTIVDGSSLDVHTLEDVACATDPLPAAVIPSDGGFLVASASGRSFGACSLDDGVPGPAKELQVMRLDAVTQQLALSSSFEAPDPVTQIAMVKRPGGAWLVWHAYGTTTWPEAPIVATLLDASGMQLGPIMQLTHEGETWGPFAAAALGSRLALAWVDDIDPSTPNLRLDLFDDDGAHVSGTVISTAPSSLNGRLSLLASPDESELLLAWSDRLPPALAVVRVARFSCAGKP